MLNRYRDVFKCLASQNVEYVVIGGIAAILHGVPRATFDLAILIKATPENAARLLAALREAGLGTADLTTPADVLEHEISTFSDLVRIDVQTRTPGVEFAVAREHRTAMTFQGIEFFILSREDLVASKRASGRPVDLSDVAQLEAAGG